MESISVEASGCHSCRHRSYLHETWLQVIVSGGSFRWAHTWFVDGVEATVLGVDALLFVCAATMTSPGSCRNC